MFVKKGTKKPLAKHGKETLRSVLFAARNGGVNNGETNCCGGTQRRNCADNGTRHCCNF